MTKNKYLDVNKYRDDNKSENYDYDDSFASLFNGVRKTFPGKQLPAYKTARQKIALRKPPPRQFPPRKQPSENYHTTINSGKLPFSGKLGPRTLPPTPPLEFLPTNSLWKTIPWQLPWKITSNRLLKFATKYQAFAAITQSLNCVTNNC